MLSVLNSPTKTAHHIEAIAKRIKVIDALRGFALFGIILTHSCQLYEDLYAGSESLSGFNSAVNAAVSFLFRGRAFLIFSFLFGLSFAIQIQSAKAKQRTFISRFVWRLTILLIIGYFHRLIFHAEILQIYAMLGVALIAFTNFKNKELLLASVLFYVASIVVKFCTPELTGVVTPLADTARNSELLKFIGIYRLEPQILTGRAFVILSLFLLGLYAGKKKIFNDTLENQLFFKKVLIRSGIAVVVITVVYFLVKFSGMAPESVLKALYNAMQIIQAFFYIAVIVNLYRLKRAHKVLQWLVPVGQMGLSIYIMQSLFLTQFYGLGPGIITKMGLTSAVGITVLFFFGQVLFAYWWMSQYKFGPIEWLWRVLTNLKWEPIKKAKPLIN